MAGLHSEEVRQAGEGQPQNVSGSVMPGQQAEGEQTPGGKTPQYLTRDEALQLMREMAREMQSSTDKKIARVEKIMQKAQEQGVTMTRQQAATLVDTIDAEGQQNQPGSQKSTPAQAQTFEEQADGEELHPVLLAAQRMMEKAGIQIEDTDPELGLVDQATTDEDVFLASVRQAINAKRERLARNLPARMPGANGGAGSGGKAAVIAELQRLLYAEGAKDYGRIAALREELKKYN